MLMFHLQPVSTSIIKTKESKLIWVQFRYRIVGIVHSNVHLKLNDLLITVLHVY